MHNLIVALPSEQFPPHFWAALEVFAPAVSISGVKHLNGITEVEFSAQLPQDFYGLGVLHGLAGKPDFRTLLEGALYSGHELPAGLQNWLRKNPRTESEKEVQP